MENEQSPISKPGPVPMADSKKYNIIIDNVTAEWAKRQPGGLSELVRRLLREEKERLDKKKS